MLLPMPLIFGGIGLLLAAFAAIGFLLWRNRATDGGEAAQDSEFVATDGTEDTFYTSRLDGHLVPQVPADAKSDAPTAGGNGDVSLDGLTEEGEKGVCAETEITVTPDGREQDRQEIERLQAELQKAQKEKKALAEQVKKLDKELDEKNRLLNDREERNANLREELARQSAEIEKLTKAHAQAAAKSKAAADAVQRLAEYEADLETMKARVSEVTDRSGKLKRGIANALDVLCNTKGAASAEYLQETITDVITELNRVLHPEE